jgi:hypothetical protein
MTKWIVRIFCVLVCLLVVAFYWPWLHEHRTYYVLDFMGNWQPLLSYMGQRMRTGALPLWNPYVCNGVPQFFFPTIAYPLNWLFAVFDFSRALAVVSLLHQLIAGIGMFLLIESLGWGLWPAAFGGMALALSGTMFSAQIDYVLQGSFAFFPLSLWALRKCRQDAGAPLPQAAGASTEQESQQRSAGILPASISASTEQESQQRSAGILPASISAIRLAVASISIALMITADMPEIFIPGLLLLFLYSILDFRSDKKTLAVRWSAIACGILLSAPMILPTLEWLRLSPRASGLSMAVVFANSSNWYHLLCTVLSQPLGDYYTLNKFEPLFSSLYITDFGMPFAKLIFSTYVGPIVTTLAIWGACDRSWKWRFHAIALLVMAIYVSLGPHSPFLVDIVHVTNFTWFRNPIKDVPWITFATVLMSARGLLMLRSGEQKSALVATVALWTAILLLGTLLLANDSSIGAIASSTIPGLAPLSEMGVGSILRAAIASSAIGLGTCLLYAIRLKCKVNLSLISAGVLLSSAAMLMNDAWHYNFHPGPVDFYTSRIASADVVHTWWHATGHTGMPRLAHLVGTAVPTQWMDFRRPESVMFYKRQMLHPVSGMNEGIATTNYWINGQTADNRNLWNRATDQFSAGESSLLGMLSRMSGTNCMVTLTQRQSASGQLVDAPQPDRRFFNPVHIDPQLNLSFYEVVAQLPRAYFASNIQWGKPHSAVVDFISSPEQTHFDPSKLTLLEHNNDGETGPTQASNPNQANQSKVVWVQDAPEHVVLNATTKQAAFLVLTDQFYPGWQAYIDGQRSETYRANALFRAVFVPAGQHRVEFVYSPLSLWLGFAIAGATALALGVICLWSVLTRGRSQGV